MNPLKWPWEKKSFVENEIELLTSRTVSEKTIDNLIKSGKNFIFLEKKMIPS